MLKTKNTKQPFLSVIIPCFNETENLKRGVLKQVYEFLSQKEYTWEVIISDDGSTDDSIQIIEKEISKLNGFRLVKNDHGGKPYALLCGLRQAKGEYILFTDMDQSTPINELDKLVPWVYKSYPVVIGSRGLNRNNFSLYRRVGSVAFLTFRRLLLLRHIIDTQCGFKLFKTNILKTAFPKLEFFKSKQRTQGWKVTSYDVELLHILEKMGSTIKEVEVVWHDQDTSKGKGGGLSRYIRESREMLLQILRVKLNDIRGLY